MLNIPRFYLYSTGFIIVAGSVAFGTGAYVRHHYKQLTVKSRRYTQN